MIHWRFLLQKSYIFVCGIIGAGILTFSFFTINWLGLYFACAVQIFVFIFGAVVASIAKRFALQHSYKQAVFDGMLVGVIACIPIGFTVYNFLLYGLMLFICGDVSKGS